MVIIVVILVISLIGYWASRYAANRVSEQLAENVLSPIITFVEDSVRDIPEKSFLSKLLLTMVLPVEPKRYIPESVLWLNMSSSNTFSWELSKMTPI